MASKPSPKFIGISEDNILFEPGKNAIYEYKLTVCTKTNNAWANKNRKKAVWIDPICEDCDDFPHLTYCVGHNPYDQCEICGKAAPVYRMEER